MLKTILAATVAVVAMGGVANAQGYANLGAGYTFGDAEVLTGVLRLGADIGPNFGLEAEGQIGLDGDTSAGTTLEIDHILAGFARVRGQVGPNAEIFARAGYYFSEATATTGVLSVSADDDDFAVGVGAEFAIGARTGIRLDYTNFGFDDDSNQVTAALVVNF